MVRWYRVEYKTINQLRIRWNLTFWISFCDIFWHPCKYAIELCLISICSMLFMGFSILLVGFGGFEIDLHVGIHAWHSNGDNEIYSMHLECVRHELENTFRFGAKGIDRAKEYSWALWRLNFQVLVQCTHIANHMDSHHSRMYWFAGIWLKVSVCIRNGNHMSKCID